MQPGRRAAAWSAAVLVLAVSLGGGAALVQIATVGYARSQLQVEADRIALEVGRTLAEQGDGDAEGLADSFVPIRFGQWDGTRRRFLPGGFGANAVEVIVGGPDVRFFSDRSGRLFGLNGAAERTSAVAAVRPRDIVFAVDLSGAMTGGTRAALECLFQAMLEGSAYSEDRELRLLYSDLGFDSYPGDLEAFGAPWQVGGGCEAYEALISVEGPLADRETNERYRIEVGDSVEVRRKKAYLAVIEQQVVRLMPEARPNPVDPKNFEYWAAYLDGLLASEDEGARIGYASYVRFMLDHGRNLRAGGQHVALSQHSEDCVWHAERVDGVAFESLPRTQPMHNVRLGLLAAMNDIVNRNRDLVPGVQRDRVAIVTFDSLSPGGAWVEQSFTEEYAAAFGRCTRLQAAGERTRVPTGIAALELAEKFLRGERERGRDATKHVVFVTAGPASVDKPEFRDQIASMASRGETVDVVSVGLPGEVASTSPVGVRRESGVELRIRDAVSAVTVVLVQ